MFLKSAASMALPNRHFISIANKRALKNLTVIDPVSKVAPRIVPALSMQGEGVAEVLDEIWHEEKFKFLLLKFLYLQKDGRK